ncbi:MAG: hypothetical protein HYY04_12120 [Chloroflexi bacterium]|nr:hypothetical protein [Chloroflexota bacterium]
MLAITGGRILTITRGEIATGTVLVDGGKIVAIGPPREVPAPPAARIVDASGKFVMPGLIEGREDVRRRTAGR